MKKIVCEMCGSSDFAKADGMFVCQTCGMKYSIDEAKALMVDDGNDVPAANAAPQSNKLENLKVLAQRAREEGDSESAEKYYNEIKLEDPNNWEANFYAAYYRAHNIKIAQIGSAAINLANAFPSIIKLMAESEPEDKHLLICTKLLTDVITFSTMLITNANNNLSDNYDRRHEQYQQWCVPIMQMQKSYLDSVLANTKCYELLKMGYKNLAESCRKYNFTRNNNFELIALDADKKLVQIQLLETEQKLLAAKKYWEEHPEEKAKLDAEMKECEDSKAAIEEEIRKLDEEFENIPEKLQAAENRKKIEELKNQKAGLGLFKGKEKEALQAQIDELNSKNSRELLPIISQKEAPLSEQKNAKYKELEEVKKKINDLSSKITQGVL